MSRKCINCGGALRSKNVRSDRNNEFITMRRKECIDCKERITTIEFEQNMFIDFMGTSIQLWTQEIPFEILNGFKKFKFKRGNRKIENDRESQ